VRLESIKVFGFKSFAGKVDIHLGGGMTGVLGPNGCGKSNIADAIRWVLGEQSAKHLRGSSMEDVIFKGTRDRKPLGFAEVSLHIRNEHGFIPVDYSEVTVGRRLYRSGVSEYLLNKTSCRLKDIRSLFLDSGLGVQAYSIFEREMIDEILNDNSTRRRELFEEASGIMKYKVRRKEALRKLESSTRDLERLSDIISEIDREVRSLARQVGRARRYRRLKLEVRDLDIAVAVRRIAAFAQRRRELDGERARMAAEEASAAADLGRAETEGEQLRLRLLEVGDELSRARTNLAVLRDAIGESRQRFDVLTERKEGLRRSIETLSREADSEGARTVQLAEEIARCEDELRQHDGIVASRRVELQREEEELRALEARFQGMRNALAERQQLMLDLKQEASEKSHELARERTRREELTRRRTKIEDERAANTTRDEMLARKLADRSRELEALAGKLAEHHERLAALSAERAEFITRREAETEKAREIARERASVISRLETFEELQRSYEAYDQGARSVLLAGGDGVLGSLAELLRVDDELGGAIEAALGDAVQAVVVRDAGVAIRCMQDLAREERGRVTFCPVLEMADATPVRLGAPGRRLADLVGVRNEGARPVVELLLGRVHLVPGAEEAREHSREYPSLTWVTPAGDAFHNDRRISGGGASLGRRLLLRETEIQRLQTTREALDGALRDHEREIAHLEREVSRTEATAAERETARRSDEAFHGEVQESVRRLGFERELGAEEARGLLRELEALGAEEADLAARIEKWELAWNEASALDAERVGDVERLTAAVVELERDREAKLTAVGNLRIAFVQSNAELESKRVRRDRFALDRTASTQAGDERRRGIATATEQIEAIDAEIGEIEVILSGSSESIDQASREAERLAELEAQTRNEWAEQDVVLKRTRERSNAARESLHRSELELSTLGGEGDHLRERLREEHGAVILSELDARGLPLVVIHERRRIYLPPSAIPVGVAAGHHASSIVNGHPHDGSEGLTEPTEAKATEATEATSTRTDGHHAEPAELEAFERVEPAEDEFLEYREEIHVSDPMSAEPPDRYREIPEAEWASHLVELRTRLSGFGPVNEMAVEDFDSKKTRLDFLSQQRDDLTKARDELLETIRKVNREARERFAATFSKAQENYRKLHEILFPGGYAELKLEGDDPLEADIVMVAQPRGKRVESINLLSSGERALTAIALIFAIYMIKPSPFCILDEVDAPLDDANIDRFVDLIREFSQKTQFIIITHNKRTMEACDSLYGVTMEEPGVSKLVSVHLRDGDLHVEGERTSSFATT
jgi:chromosome segregation protein